MCWIQCITKCARERKRNTMPDNVHLMPGPTSITAKESLPGCLAAASSSQSHLQIVSSLIRGHQSQWTCSSLKLCRICLVDEVASQSLNLAAEAPASIGVFHFNWIPTPCCTSNCKKKYLMDEQRPHPVGSSLLGSWRPQVNQAPGQPWSGSRFQVNLDQVPGSRSILIRWADQGGFTAWHWVLFAGRWAAAYDGNQSRPQSPQPAQPHIPAPAIQGKGLSWPGQASNEQTIQMEYFLPFSLLLFRNQAS